METYVYTLHLSSGAEPVVQSTLTESELLTAIAQNGTRFMPFTKRGTALIDNIRASAILTVTPFPQSAVTPMQGGV